VLAAGNHRAYFGTLQTRRNVLKTLRMNPMDLAEYVGNPIKDAYEGNLGQTRITLEVMESNVEIGGTLSYPARLSITDMNSARHIAMTCEYQTHFKPALMSDLSIEN